MDINTDYNDNPTAASRPFDKVHGGFSYNTGEYMPGRGASCRNLWTANCRAWPRFTAHGSGYGPSAERITRYLFDTHTHQHNFVGVIRKSMEQDKSFVADSKKDSIKRTTTVVAG